MAVQTGPLADLRERLKYQASSLTCSLSPKDCREMLVLIEQVEKLLPPAIEPGRYPVKP